MKYNYNRTDVYGVNLNSYFDWAAGRTAFGAELRNEDLVSGNLGEPLSQTHHIKGTDRDYTLGINRTNISGYLEHNLLLRHFTLSAGFVAVKNTWSNMNMTVYPGILAATGNYMLRIIHHSECHPSQRCTTKCRDTVQTHT